MSLGIDTDRVGRLADRVRVHGHGPNIYFAHSTTTFPYAWPLPRFASFNRWSRALAVATIAFGCAGTADLARKVDEKASRTWDCPLEEVVIRFRPEPNTFEARGCGNTGVYKCRKDGRCEDLTDAAKHRFIAEAPCNGDVVVREVSPKVFLAEGCSLQATYICTFKNALVQCILESRGR